MTTRPPAARRTPFRQTVHGEERVDDYAWLREKNDPEVIRHLEGENRYAEAVTAPLRDLRETLYGEMVARIQETDVSAPVRRDNVYYYVRTEAGKQYPIYCRRSGSPEAPEQVLLDLNDLAGEGGYLRLGAFRVSPDHSLLAYSLDVDGSEEYVLRVLDLRSGELLPDRIGNTSDEVEWAADSRTLLYAVLSATKRPHKLFRHRVGDAPGGDVEVFHEPDEAYFLSLATSRSRRFLILTLKSKVSSEVRVLERDRPGEGFRLLEPRRQGIEYYVTHQGERFWILTNDSAPTFRVLEAPVESPERTSWREVLPARDDVTLEKVDAFREHLVIHQRRGGLRGIEVLNPVSGEWHDVAFPEPVYTYSREPNPEYDSRALRLAYSSLVSPRTVCEYDMDRREWTLLKQDPVLGGYDAADYRSERVFATAGDGTRVPISLVYRKGMKRDGRNPTYLYGYGAYGLTSEPGFRAERVSLLDRGFIFAIAHVRGGGEMGRRWYEDGKLLRKTNTFTDFIAAAEHLIAGKYTSSRDLAIAGGSAGGLLMGAVANMRPDLFRVVVADVPFVDVVNTMLDDKLPLTVTEYEEWGNPNDKVYYESIRSYSPYDNVGRKDYPDILITAGLNDPRVSYWEPAKWAAKLRASKTGDGIVVLKTNMGAGHGGASGRYDHLKEIAFKYAFVIDRLRKEGEAGEVRPKPGT